MSELADGTHERSSKQISRELQQSGDVSDGCIWAAASHISADHLKEKKKKNECAEHSPEGGVRSPAQDREQARRRKTFVLIFRSVVRNKYRKIHFTMQNSCYCRWPGTKPWPGSSGVIGNCKCKRAISKASNAISSPEKYIYHGDDARCTLRSVVALWNPAVSELVNLFPEGSACVQWVYLRGSRAQRNALDLVY